MLTANPRQHQVEKDQIEPVLLDGQLSREPIARWRCPKAMILQEIDQCCSDRLLVFDNHGDFFRQARVRGLTGDVQVGAGGGQVAQRTAGAGVSRVTLALSFRFELSESAREGVYAWPMQLSAMPL